jgi:hypothetical protein
MGQSIIARFNQLSLLVTEANHGCEGDCGKEMYCEIER